MAIILPPKHGQGYEDDCASPSSAASVSRARGCVSGTLRKLARSGDVLGPAAIGEQAVMADAVEPAGQHVGGQAAGELVDGECHHFGPLSLTGAVVLPLEGGPGNIECDEAAVGDGDTVRVARQVGHHRLRTAEPPFRIDYPHGFA